MFVFDDPNAQWKPVATAPFDRDLELVVIDSVGVHALSLPCRHGRRLRQCRNREIALQHAADTLAGMAVDLLRATL